MADTELEIPPYNPEEQADTIEKMLVRKLSTSEQASHQHRTSILNVFAIAFFLIAGALCFFDAFQGIAQEKSAIHQILIVSEVGVGLLCWGIAWVGSILEDKL